MALIEHLMLKYQLFFIIFFGDQKCANVTLIN